jgi:hypothetical protein
MLVFSVLSLVTLDKSSWFCFSLGCSVYSFRVGVYVVSVPGYNVDCFYNI